MNLADTAVRHSTHVEGIKADQSGRFTKFLKRIDRDLRERLGGEVLTEFSRTRMEQLLSVVDSSLKTIYNDFQEEFSSDLRALSVYEAEFEAKTLNGLGGGLNFVIPTATQLAAAVASQPLNVHGANGGKLITPFIADWTKADRARVIGAIRQGFFEGQTTAKILQTVRGTRANGYSDGILDIMRRNAEAIITTSIQHVSSVARFKTWDANSDIIDGYEIVATLDGRTSKICRSLDGRKFKLGKGPKPPFHIRCRTTTKATLIKEFAFLDEGATRASKDGQVKRKSYYEWLKTESKAFQDDTLGPVTAKLFRDGGLSSEKFARMGLDRNFNPLTLEQMKLREPLAFVKAFGQ